MELMAVLFNSQSTLLHESHSSLFFLIYISILQVVALFVNMLGT